MADGRSREPGGDRPGSRHGPRQESDPAQIERPFVDGPPGPVEPTTRAAEAAAAAWGFEQPVLARLGMNAIFSAGPIVLRVGRPTAPAGAAIELAAVLADHGVRVPAPVRDEAIAGDDGLAVTAWERIVPIAGDPDWRAVGRMVAAVHALDRAAIPAAYPVPRCESFPWWRLDELLDEVGDVIDAPARAGLAATITRHEGWPAGLDRVVCHGDVHPGNVVMTDAGPVLLDWDLLCAGPPGWDHAMLLRLPRWGWPARWYDEFADGYGRSFAGDATTIAIAELRLVAATLMRVRAGRADPAAMPEAQRRLGFWRGDPAAPLWTPV
jgi:Ser/Thr protein kinase RdoA (MazF antagonist)